MAFALCLTFNCLIMEGVRSTKDVTVLTLLFDYSSLRIRLE